jgi:hypothetical protein
MTEEIRLSAAAVSFNVGLDPAIESKKQLSRLKADV